MYLTVIVYSRKCINGSSISATAHLKSYISNIELSTIHKFNKIVEVADGSENLCTRSGKISLKMTEDNVIFIEEIIHDFLYMS